jgi:methionine-rich copper-binding protein CopC
MVMKKIFITIAFTIFATGASAHSVLKFMSPANSAIITQTPKTIELSFKNSIYLTKITLKYEDKPTILLDLSLTKGFETDYSIPLKQFGSGSYNFEWRGLGKDGHILIESFGFFVK